MSKLRKYDDTDCQSVLLETRNPQAITAELAAIGVGFKRWPLAIDASSLADVPREQMSEAVLRAFAAPVKDLMEQGGYQSVDVVSLDPAHPDRAAMRQKFLQEHTHAEDEIRFFVAGSGLFTIHQHGHVFEVECCAGDLINLPAGTQHWFDMGEAPYFIAIRIFSNPSGWVANFTGATISERFPRYAPSQTRELT